MSAFTVMEPITKKNSDHLIHDCVSMQRSLKHTFEEDDNYSSPVMQNQHKRARVTQIQKPSDEENRATTPANGGKENNAPTAVSDKLCKSQNGFFMPLEGKNIQFLHLRHPESGPLERVMFGATPRLIWRYASSIHIPWGHPTYSRAPPPPAPNRERSVSPDIESLRDPSPPHIRITGSNDDRPEVKKMAHGAHWTYDYWFYDGEQEHSEDGDDADEDEVTAEDLCGLQAPPFWFIDEDDYGRPFDSKMEVCTFTPWSPPLGYSKDPTC